MRPLLRLAYNALRLLTWPIWAALWRLRRSSARYVSLSLRGRLEELPRPQSRLRRLLGGVRPPRRSIAEVRHLCERLANDPRAHGLVLRLEQIEAGHALLASLRTELVRLRRSGKQVVCYLPVGADQRELYVASAADRVLAMPEAGFSALGPAASRTYLAPLLARLGVRVAVQAAGRYKTAADPLLRDSMSAPDREQLEAIVRTLIDGWVTDVAERPGLTRESAAALFQIGLFGAEQARELRVVDALCYDDQLPAELGLAAHEEPLPHTRYFGRPTTLPALFRPLRPRPRIAIVRLVGTIGTTAQRGVDLHGTANALRRLARRRDVAGVLLFIDSPGGSALVSELLHREIVQLDRHKPVVSLMGDVAASGGYYLACATRTIVAHPSTLTGSIGVISMRPVLESLLARLEVHREVVSETPFADLHALQRAPTEAEEQLLRAETVRIYQRFLTVVATGRKLALDVVAELAEGRVWSGRDGHAHGLVDVLGGYHEARAALEAQLGGLAVDPEPLLVSIPMRETQPVAPLRSDQPASRALETLTPLLPLLARGERAFTYALDLPTLR